MTRATFAQKVIRWQKQYGRHDLPWQNTRDAYRIWLSEIMLQQTQVATVIPYYGRFLQRFPDVGALARGPLDAVLESWSGLGYYSRARNLHDAAGAIVACHGGRFPRDFDSVLALPGIGRSTAAAICVFAYGDRRAILDGNVKRLLARCFAIEGYPGDASVQAALWREAECALPRRGIESYTQGLMDLGATVCTRTKPRCVSCPLHQNCIAYRQGAVAKFPLPRPRKVLPQKHTQMLVLLYGGQVLLEKRPPTGIWGGLWSLPEIPPNADLGTLCAQRYGADVAAEETLPLVVHGFTHFKLDIEPRKVLASRVMQRAAQPGVVWLPVDESLDAAIPAPVRRILAAL